VLGLESMASAATRMLLGAESAAVVEGRATGIQCLSGTGALRVGADFLGSVMGHSIVYSSNPTWGWFLFKLAPSHTTYDGYLMLSFKRNAVLSRALLR